METSTENVRYWASTNPNWFRGNKELNSPRVMVWCAIWGDRIVGPYSVTSLTGDAYLAMLETFLLPILEEAPLARLRDLWFQQDGASAHYKLNVRHWLDRRFRDQWIGRAGPVEWSARSPDLTPLDYFLWGYIKSLVYLDPVSMDLAELKQRIVLAIGTITPEMLARVRVAFIERMHKCIAAAGLHIENF